MCHSAAVARFDAVIREIAERGMADPADPRWPDTLVEFFPAPDDFEAFVDWARQHPKWQFNVADVAAGTCAKPQEATVAILTNIVEEFLDDNDTVELPQ